MLILATLLAKLFFYLGVPDKDIPLVGASGGISAMYQQLYGITAVSYLSHMGGATVGLIYGLLARKKLIATRY